MRTYKLIATGRVQGVGFRYYTYSIASKYELKGWVKNLADGSVEIMVQGSDERINNLKKYLMKGNGFIKVRELREMVLEHEKFSDFNIRY